jgi:hypothetical protein
LNLGARYKVEEESCYLPMLMAGCKASSSLRKHQRLSWELSLGIEGLRIWDDCKILEASIIVPTTEAETNFKRINASWYLVAPTAATLDAECAKNVAMLIELSLVRFGPCDA